MGADLQDQSNGAELGERLEALYHAYNDTGLIRFDPLKYVYMFNDPCQREVMGLIASSLAFGRVGQIFKALDQVLEIMQYDPLDYIKRIGERPEKRLLAFRYRFVTGTDLWRFFTTIGSILDTDGSIGEFVRRQTKRGFFSGLQQVLEAFHGSRYLMPLRLKASPCKRLFMYLRWMVRDDNIDLGLWKFISPRELIIPLDTHVFQTARALGLTFKKSPSFSAALEITEKLRKLCPEDPVKYDWALSHKGIIRNNPDLAGGIPLGNHPGIPEPPCQ